MRGFPQGIRWAFGLVVLLCFGQACSQELSKKGAIASSGWAQIDCRNNEDHDQDCIPNRIDPDCRMGHTKTAEPAAQEQPTGSTGPYYAPNKLDCAFLEPVSGIRAGHGFALGQGKFGLAQAWLRLLDAV
jgi:hypothetical protein